MVRVRNLIICSIGLIWLIGCKLPASATPQKTQATPAAAFTEAALTADSFDLTTHTQVPTQRPTLTQPKPTETKLILIPSATLPFTVTQIATLTALSLATQMPAAESDRAEFVSDVTVSDGTAFAPGTAFVKTWRLRNVGDTTWTTDYKVIFMDGEQMDGPFAVELPSSVAPEQEIDVSVDFRAPLETGSYRGYWKMQNAEGEIFGMGIGAAESFWVDIVVDEQLATAEGTPTPTANVAIASASMEVDQAEYSGVCPHTFIFYSRLFLNKPATVTYNLEAENDMGVSLKLPPPVTRNLQAGNYSSRFELTFAQSLRGWVRLRITAPLEMTSNRVNFELVCQ